jgi:hypothetical protein
VLQSCTVVLLSCSPQNRDHMTYSIKLGAQPARMGCAGVRRKDLCRRLCSRRPHRRGVHALCLQPPQRSGAADFVFLRAAAGGAWPPTSTHYALLHPSGGHHRLPPQDVRGGDIPSRFFLQHSGGRMFTSLVKVDSGLSSGSIPRAPPTLWGGKRAVLWLHLFGFDGTTPASNGGRTRRRTPWRWRSRASSTTLLMSSRSYL